jgi:hypothetical protein
MRPWTTTLGALSLAFVSSYALADEVADGVVDKIDHDTKTLTLDSGETFMLESYELTDVEPGEKVTVSYEVENGEKKVLAVHPEEANESDNQSNNN